MGGPRSEYTDGICMMGACFDVYFLDKRVSDGWGGMVVWWGLRA